MYGWLFVSNCQNCCLCAYKSQLYRLNGQQNRLDLYHNQLNHLSEVECIHSIRASIIHGGVIWVDSCHIQLNPRWRKSTWFTPWRKPTRSFTPTCNQDFGMGGNHSSTGRGQVSFSSHSDLWCGGIESIFSTMDDWVERGTNRVNILHRGWSSQMWH